LLDALERQVEQVCGVAKAELELIDQPAGTFDPHLSDLSDRIQSMTRLTATDASRTFSDVLNRVAAGEEIEITRNGAAVAVIGPPSRRQRRLPPDAFRELMESLPRVDEDFVRDLDEIRGSVGPPRDPWTS